MLQTNHCSAAVASTGRFIARPRLLGHNRSLGGCFIGEARITPAFDLAKEGIKHIVHTVGPVWHGREDAKVGDTREDVLLASCYWNCLVLAEANQIAALAFPAISTGVYHFPKRRAAGIAVGQVWWWLEDHEYPSRVVFSCFNAEDAAIYAQVLARIK